MLHTYCLNIKQVDHNLLICTLDTTHLQIITQKTESKEKLKYLV